MQSQGTMHEKFLLLVHTTSGSKAWDIIYYLCPVSITNHPAFLRHWILILLATATAAAAAFTINVGLAS